MNQYYYYYYPWTLCSQNQSTIKKDGLDLSETQEKSEIKTPQTPSQKMLSYEIGYTSQRTTRRRSSYILLFVQNRQWIELRVPSTQLDLCVIPTANC